MARHRTRPPTKVKKLTRVGLADAIRSRLGDLTLQEADDLVDLLVETLKEALSQGEFVRIPRFGVFDLVDIPERYRYNPQLARSVLKPPKRVVKFRFFRYLKRKGIRRTVTVYV